MDLRRVFKWDKNRDTENLPKEVKSFKEGQSLDFDVRRRCSNADKF